MTALSFNGTSDFASSAINLSGLPAGDTITLGFWSWWNTFGTNNDLQSEFSPNSNVANGTWIVDFNYSTVAGTINFGSVNGGSSIGFKDRFAQPSAGAWHHYLLIMNRNRPINFAYVDGGLQGLTATDHSMGGGTSWANNTMYLMSRGGASLFGAGKLAELAIWQSDFTFTTNSQQRTASALAAGCPPPYINPDQLIAYWPMGLGSPDTDMSPQDYVSRAIHPLTLNGTSVVAGPPASSGLSRIN